MEATRFEIYATGATKEDLEEAVSTAATLLAAGRAGNRIAADDGSWTITEVPVSPKMDPNTLYVVGSDAAGNVAIRCTRSTLNAHADEHIMTAALELSQAVELRGITFPERKLGGLLVRPATSPWQPIPKDLPPGKYLVTVATDNGPSSEILVFDGRGWLHEGEYTFEHGYYFHPVLYQASPAPGELSNSDED